MTISYEGGFVPTPPVKYTWRLSFNGVGYHAGIGQTGTTLLPFQFPNRGAAKFRKRWVVRNPVFEPGPSGRLFGTVTTANSSYRPVLRFRSGRAGVRRVSVRYLRLTSTPTPLFPNSRVKMTSFGSALSGGMTQFAMWDTDSPDPLQAIVHSVNSGTIGGVGQAWTRHSATVTLPESTRYFGVGGRFVGVPSAAGVLYSLKNVMAQTADLAGVYPTTFESPRMIKADVLPDRINWSPNPTFWNNSSNWFAIANGTFARATSPSTRSGYVGRFAVDANTVGRMRHTVAVSRPGRRYRAQVKVFASESVRITQPQDTSNVVQHSVSPAETANSEGQTFWVYFTPFNSAFNILFNVDNSSRNYQTFVDFSDMLVEEDTGQADFTYFDGSTSGECVWTGTAGNSQSTYYKNRIERFAATKRILADNAPMGIGQGTPTFGTLPL